MSTTAARGQTVPIVDPTTGEERPAQIFVAVLGASNYTFVEATWSQGLADWLGSHVRCLKFLGGAPELLVPDHLKSVVKSPSLYEPDLNPSYQELAAHYGVTVLPARAYKLRDNKRICTQRLTGSRMRQYPGTKPRLAAVPGPRAG